VAAAVAAAVAAEARLAGRAELSGVGLGWRPEIAGVVAGAPDLGFTEVIAEGFDPRAAAGPSRGPADLRQRGVAVVPHGVRLSLGGTDPLDARRVAHLAACAAALDAPLVSEHVAFVRAGGLDAGHLLPLPRTREALDVLARNAERTQAELDVPLALEPIAALLDWPEDEMGEAEFLTRLLDRTGARLLLDVANVHANAVNRGRDARAVLDTLPLDRIAYVHVAGGDEHGGLYHDTHTAAVPDPVLALLRDLVERLPAPPPVLLERDGRYPPAAALHAELAAVRAAADPRDRPPPDPRTTPAGPAPEPGGARRRLRPVPRGGAHPLDHRQAGLVTALVATGPVPAGLDTARVAATREALVRKRAALAATAWPRLAAAVPDWPATFAAHARAHGGSPPGALRDGWEVARALRDRGALPVAAGRELAGREAALRYDGASAPRRRGWWGRVRRRARREDFSPAACQTPAGDFVPGRPLPAVLRRMRRR
jgi:uncharacterized protein (UPF0276 family)